MALKKAAQREKAGYKWVATPLVSWEKALFNDPMLGWRDKAAFMTLHKFIKKDKVEFPCLNELARESTMSITAFRSACNHLEYAGWIDMTVRRRDKFSVGGGIIYTLWYHKA